MTYESKMELQQLYLERLLVRDSIEKNYSQLFIPATFIEYGNVETPDDHDEPIKHLQKELYNKEQEINKLRYLLELRFKDNEKLNDEIVGLNIENSLLQEKLDSLQQDYDKIVSRWLKKAQSEADAMNSVLD